MQPLTASVIFTTYNQPDWLEKVLLGFAAQDRHDFEVIVADDGSGEETRERIERLRPRLPVPLQHFWQADDGFRKCEALNGAIAASFLIGLTEALAGTYISYAYKDAIAFLIMIAVLLWRPQGLFGRRIGI